LGGLPGSINSSALGINNAGLAVGISEFQVGNNSVATFATEWSAGSAVQLGSLPVTRSSGAEGINDVGQVVGSSLVGGYYVQNELVGAVAYATEWSGGTVINLGGLPGSTASLALGINNAGLAVGYSMFGGVNGVSQATEWSAGKVISVDFH
jgi:uncharacterized membrane protein